MKVIKRSTRKSGHSVIATLPPEVLQKLNMSVGDEIEYVLKETGIEIRKANKTISNDFLELVNEVMEDYNHALESLVER